MKTIGMVAFLILSAQLGLASDFTLPSLKYDQREPGTLPSTPASGRSSAEVKWPDHPKTPKARPISGNIDRDGIIVPTTRLGSRAGDLSGIDLIDPNYKLRIDKAPKVDQGIVITPDARH